MRKTAVLVSLVAVFVLAVTPAVSRTLQKNLKINKAKIHKVYFRSGEVKRSNRFLIGLKLAYSKYKSARKQADAARLRLSRKAQSCAKRSFSTKDQRKARCRGGDTVATCQRKLFRWCVRAAANRYRESRSAMKNRASSLLSAVTRDMQRHGYGGEKRSRSKSKEQEFFDSFFPQPKWPSDLIK